MKNEGMKFLLGVPTHAGLGERFTPKPLHGFILHVIVDTDAV
jgi:hypothetical protein